MDCFRELYGFFENSPKRQSFMEIVIDAHSPDNKKQKLKNLCKTRWVERHATFKTIFDLYEFIVITLDQICEPTDDDRYYPNGEIWNWDSKTKTLANGLRHTMKNFGHIFNFVCAKEILEPMRPIVTSLQGRLIDVYFGYKKIEDVTNHYSGIRADIDAWFARMYTKVLSLAELVQSAEERPRACNRQQNRDNTPAETVPSYWKRSVAIPLLDTVCAELQSRFSEEKRAHFELCELIPAVLTVKTSEEISELAKVLQAKWEDLLPVSSALESELFRWKGYCQQKALGDVSVTGLLSSHADNLFFSQHKRATEDSSCITDRQHRGGEVVLLCEKNPHMVKEQDDHRQAVGSSRDCHALPQCPYRSGQSIQQVHGNPPKAHDVSFSAP